MAKSAERSISRLEPSGEHRCGELTGCGPAQPIGQIAAPARTDGIAGGPR